MSYISAAQAKQIAQKAVDNLKDGTLVPKLADNLTPYAEDSGTTQTQPFFLEGTATGNGESRVDAKQVPAYAFLQEKRGNMICVNQLANPSSYRESGSDTDWSFTCDGNKITLVVSNEISTNTYVGIGINSTSAYWRLPVGHSHLYSTNNSNAKIRFRDGYTGMNYSNVGIINKTGSEYVLPTLFLEAGLAAGTYTIVITISDLTQWFNGNIPAYLLSHPEAFGRYYKGSLAYEPGRLEPATGRYLTSVGRNIWDEEWEVGRYDVTTGEKQYGNQIRSKNKINVSPNETYYCTLPYIADIYAWKCFYDIDENFISAVASTSFVTPSNCYFITFYIAPSYGTTYKKDITISRYYEGESGYDKYYTHEVLATIDTGTEQLGFLDYKVPSGLITRQTGSVDLGTLEWSYSANGATSFRASAGTDMKSTDTNEIANILCSKYTDVGTAQQVYAGSKTIAINGQSVWVYDHSAGTDAATFKAAMSGVILYYELATPTTEQGTPFQETVPIDDFGQLSWSNTDVPQGNQIFYPVDYKAYEDTLIKYTDGDATSLAKKSYVDSLIGDINTVLDSVNGVVI